MTLKVKVPVWIGVDVGTTGVRARRIRLPVKQ